MSLLVLQLLIQTLITQLSGKWSRVFEGHTVECSVSHNWDVMVRGRSLIDPCWSALNRTVNRGLLTMQHSRSRKHCKRKWQQPLCWSCCQLWRHDGDGLLTHFCKPPTRPQHHQTMRGDGLHPARLFETKEPNREWRVCASSETQYPLSPGGFGQTNTVPRGGVHLLVSTLLGSTAEVGILLFAEAKKFWQLVGQRQIVTNRLNLLGSQHKISDLSHYMWAEGQRK